MLFFPFLDLSSLLVSSVAPDVEGFHVVFFNPFLPHHGLIHTYLAASIIGFLVAVATYPLKKWTGNAMAIFGLRQSSSFKKVLLTPLLGAYSHILLDSLLYPEMSPFYPLRGNPFILGSSEYFRFGTVYGLCSLSFLIALIIYIKKRQQFCLLSAKKA